nr:PREDICTED: putative F-box protein At3g16210 [Daucus carota subsp. sativus]
MALSLQRYAYADQTNLTLKRRIKKEKERSKLIALEKIDYLPEDMFIEILSRLSVKDLLQLKSVCKSWYEIISSPNFVSKHLNNYYNNNDDWRGCLLVKYKIAARNLWCELMLDETLRVIDYEVLHNRPTYCSYICGPCDGLYYVYENYGIGRALWNPAINEFKTLPKIICKPDLLAEFTYSRYEVYGFGF